MKIINDLQELLCLLILIKYKYKNKKIPMSINLYGNRVLAIKSICLDNYDEDLGIQLFFEADLEDKAEQSSVFAFYTQGDEVLTDVPENTFTPLDKQK